MIWACLLVIHKFWCYYCCSDAFVEIYLLQVYMGEKLWGWSGWQEILILIAIQISPTTYLIHFLKIQQQYWDIITPGIFFWIKLNPRKISLLLLSEKQKKRKFHEWKCEKMSKNIFLWVEFPPRCESSHFFFLFGFFHSCCCCVVRKKKNITCFPIFSPISLLPTTITKNMWPVM